MKFDEKKVQEAIRSLIEGFGEEVTEHTKETPERCARMYKILLGGCDKDPSKHMKLFTAKNKNTVMVSNINFFGFCAHHMLPFYGKIAIAYVPNEKVIGLSKLGRIARVFTKKLQVQEELTESIGEFLFESELDPDGVAIIVDAKHMCANSRGLRSPGMQTRTTATFGEIDMVEFMRYVDNTKENLFGY